MASTSSSLPAMSRLSVLYSLSRSLGRLASLKGPGVDLQLETALVESDVKFIPLESLDD